MIKRFIKNNKKFIIIYSLLLIIGLTTIIWSFNNYNIYSEPIAKINSVTDTLTQTEELSRSILEIIKYKNLLDKYPRNFGQMKKKPL